MKTTTIDSPIGGLRLLADAKGLVSLDFLKSKEVQPKKKEWIADSSGFRSHEKALKDFFGKGKSLPRLSPHPQPLSHRKGGEGGTIPRGEIGGTDFQRKVWREIEKIPLGRTKTYLEIAKAVGKPGAARAVGTACGANPIPLFVPCHRVVASNGGLGGFSGGLDIKQKLLRMEGSL